MNRGVTRLLYFFRIHRKNNINGYICEIRVIIFIEKKHLNSIDFRKLKDFKGTFVRISPYFCLHINILNIMFTLHK